MESLLNGTRRVLASLVLGGILLTGQLASADTILINDLDNASLSFSSIGRVVQNGLNPLCFGGETCEAIVLAPTPDATIVASSIFRDVTTGLITISEAGGLSVSDYFTSDVERGAISFKLGFGSDSENGGLTLCPPGGCTFTESGLPQLVGTVGWSDGTVDSVYVQSDVESNPSPVPEPSSLFLVGTGLVALVSRLRHRGPLSVARR